MVLKSLSDLKGIVTGKPPRKLVLAAAQDQHSLGAVIRAWEDRIVEPILVGDKEVIQNICYENGYNFTGL
ncbi:MAG: phosphate butyryltransferase, partial [Bacteroidales bacterium]|nr:phosphate butyryltransferase [Bacteroidales bacterium]